MKKYTRIQKSKKQQTQPSRSGEFRDVQPATTPAVAQSPPWQASIYDLHKQYGNYYVTTVLSNPENADLMSIQRFLGMDMLTSVGKLIQSKKKYPVLSPYKISLAQGWYARRSDLYTTSIITRIQQVVGAPSTGTIDRPTILAVARWQSQRPPLKVDGIAGPRTMPAAFPIGLAVATAQNQYVTAAKKAMNRWAQLGTARKRAEALLKAVNARLIAAKVPPCTIGFARLGEGNAQFSFDTWRIEVDRGKYDQATLSLAEQTSLVDTIYHEARHAEQWFRMARLMAGMPKYKTAAKLHQKTGIKPSIVQQAIATKPPAAGSIEALIALGWFESIEGKDMDYRNRVLTELNKRGKILEAAVKAYEQALTKYKTIRRQQKLAKQKSEQAETKFYQISAIARQNPSEQNKLRQIKAFEFYNKWIQKYEDLQTKRETAYANVVKLHKPYKVAWEKEKLIDEKYRNLPEEADAYRQGTAIAQAYKRQK